MAKREKKEKEVILEEKGITSEKLSKDLVRSLNSDAAATGKIAWCLASDDDNPTDVKEFISTGSTLLDYIVANKKNGGIPVGKVTEIAGEEASGKSLICAHVIAETQRRGGIAVYIDTENSANPDFLQRLGVDLKKLVYSQPSSLEEVGAVMEKTILTARAKAPGKLITIVFDGVAATPTLMELEGDYEISMDMQLQKSKIMSKMMRKVTEMIGKERVALVITNQLKVKIGVQYGDPMTTPGGKAVGYHASIRLRLFTGKKKKAVNGKETESEEGQGDVYGIHTSCKVVKSRLGPPWRKCEFDILFANGIDDTGSWFDKLHELDEIMLKDGFAYMTSVPSGEVEDEGVNKGKDLGLRFRKSKWKEFLNSKPLAPKIDLKTGEVEVGADKKLVQEPFDVKSHVLGLLERHMVVRYDQKPHDMELDPESLMDAEAAVEAVLGS